MLFLPWVWEHMPSEIVLLIGGNHVLCSNSPYTLLDFLHTRPSARGGGAAAATVTSTTAVYDYLGAPWHNKQGRGGGGGVSLRNATTMLAILTASLSSAASSASTEEPHLKWGDEDVFFVSYMLHANHQHKLKNKDGYPHFNLATTEVRLTTASIILHNTIRYSFFWKYCYNEMPMHALLSSRHLHHYSSRKSQICVVYYATSFIILQSLYVVCVCYLYALPVVNSLILTANEIEYQ